VPGRVSVPAIWVLVLVLYKAKCTTVTPLTDGLRGIAFALLVCVCTPDLSPGVSSTPSQPSPLESLRGRWQSAAEALCAQQGLNPSLLGVIVSEVVEAEGVELPAGVQHFRQVQDWVATTSTQAHRMV